MPAFVPRYELALGAAAAASSATPTTTTNVAEDDAVLRHIAVCPQRALAAAVVASPNAQTTTLLAWRTRLPQAEGHVALEPDVNLDPSESHSRPVWELVWASDLTQHIAAAGVSGLEASQTPAIGRTQTTSNAGSSALRLQQLKQRQLLLARSKMALAKKKASDGSSSSADVPPPVPDATSTSSTETSTSAIGTQTDPALVIRGVSWRADGSCIHVALISGDLLVFGSENGALLQTIKLKTHGNERKRLSTSSGTNEKQSNLDTVRWKPLDLRSLLNSRGHHVVSSTSIGFSLIAPPKQNDRLSLTDSISGISEGKRTSESHGWLPFSTTSLNDVVGGKASGSDFLTKNPRPLSDVYNILPPVSIPNTEFQSTNLDRRSATNTTAQNQSQSRVGDVSSAQRQQQQQQQQEVLDEESTLIAFDDSGMLTIRLGAHHVVGQLNLCETFGYNLNKGDIKSDEMNSNKITSLSALDLAILPTTMKTLDIPCVTDSLGTENIKPNAAKDSKCEKPQSSSSAPHSSGITIFASLLESTNVDNVVKGPSKDLDLVLCRFDLFDTRSSWLHKVYSHLNRLRTCGETLNDIAQGLVTAADVFENERSRQRQFFDSRMGNPIPQSANGGNQTSEYPNNNGNNRYDPTDPFAVQPQEALSDNGMEVDVCGVRQSKTEKDWFYLGFLQLLMTFDTSPNFMAYVSQDLSKSQHLRSWTKTVNGSLRCISQLMMLTLPTTIERVILLLEELLGYARWDSLNGIGLLSEESCEVCLQLCIHILLRAQDLFLDLRRMRSRFEIFVRWMERVLDAIEFGEDQPDEDRAGVSILVETEPVIEFFDGFIKSNFLTKLLVKDDSKQSSSSRNSSSSSSPTGGSGEFAVNDDYAHLNLLECLQQLVVTICPLTTLKPWSKYKDQNAMNDNDMSSTRAMASSSTSIHSIGTSTSSQGGESNASSIRNQNQPLTSEVKGMSMPPPLLLEINSLEGGSGIDRKILGKGCTRIPILSKGSKDAIPISTVLWGDSPNLMQIGISGTMSNSIGTGHSSKMEISSSRNVTICVAMNVIRRKGLASDLLVTHVGHRQWKENSSDEDVVVRAIRLRDVAQQLNSVRSSTRQDGTTHEISSREVEESGGTMPLNSQCEIVDVKFIKVVVDDREKGHNGGSIIAVVLASGMDLIELQPRYYVSVVSIPLSILIETHVSRNGSTDYTTTVPTLVNNAEIVQSTAALEVYAIARVGFTATAQLEDVPTRLQPFRVDVLNDAEIMSSSSSSSTTTGVSQHVVNVHGVFATMSTSTPTSNNDSKKGMGRRTCRIVVMSKDLSLLQEWDLDMDSTAIRTTVES